MNRLFGESLWPWPFLSIFSSSVVVDGGVFSPAAAPVHAADDRAADDDYQNNDGHRNDGLPAKSRPIRLISKLVNSNLGWESSFPVSVLSRPATWPQMRQPRQQRNINWKCRSHNQNLSFGPELLRMAAAAALLANEGSLSWFDFCLFFHKCRTFSCCLKIPWRWRRWWECSCLE